MPGEGGDGRGGEEGSEGEMGRRGGKESESVRVLWMPVMVEE